MIELAYLLGFNLFIFLSYMLFTSKLKFEITDRIISASILGSFQIVTTLALLGALGKLMPLYAQITNAAISFAILVFSLRLPRKQGFNSIGLHTIAILNGKMLFYGALILIAYALVFFLAIIIPPFSWDSLTYHLPAIFGWAKSSKLVFTQPIRDPSYYPQNGELLTLWIYFLTNKLNLLNLVQFPFTFLLAISTYSVSKKLNLSNSFLAIPLVLLTPVIMIQSATSYVDVISAAFFVSALSLLLGYLTSKRIAFLILASISMGLFCGVKPFGWAISFIFIIVIIVYYLYNKKLIRTRIIFFSILFIFIAGGFWYIRNLILTGNINFPYNIRIFGITIMKGIKEPGYNMHLEQWFVNNRWEWWFYPIYDRIRGELVYSVESGFGAQFLLGLISILFSFYIAIIKKDKLALFVFLLFPASLLLIFNMRACILPRYVIFLCALSAVAIIYAYNHLKSPYNKILSIFTASVIVFSFSTAIFQINLHQESALQYYVTHKKIPVYTYLTWEYGELADTWKWLDDNTEPGSVIDFNYTELIMYLYGAKINKNIVNIDTCDNLFSKATHANNYEEWLDKLKYYRVSYLYLAENSCDPNNNYKDIIWVKEHPEIFTRLKTWPYTSLGTVSIYKIRL